MQKIRIDEKISIWQKVEITFNDEKEFIEYTALIMPLRV